MAKKITVYSTRTCPYCIMLTNWLREKKIDFTEYKVDMNPIAAQKMLQVSGQRSVPFTTIEDDDGQLKGVLGFDRVSLEAALA
jgi:glutaredoxin 3